jgi:hypothetical protein
MRKVTIAVVIATALLFCIVSVPGRGGDFEVDSRHVKSIEIRNVSARNNKNVALDIVVNPPPNTRLPKGISALVNNHQVNLYDDGRWPDEHANDGIYTAAGATKNGEPLDEKAIFRPGSGLYGHHAMPKISCKFVRVECPKDCTSIIFHSKCVICFDLRECTIEF